MKQHGISPSSVGNSGAGVKKETKEPKEPKKEAPKSRKKRKLAEVEEDVGDVDEPVKGEFKAEDPTHPVKSVKSESVKAEADAIDVKSERVKMEHGRGFGVFEAMAGSESSTTLSRDSHNNDDDDDEVLVVGETRRSGTSVSTSSDWHVHENHHSLSHSHSPMPTVGTTPGVPLSFDYSSANMGFAMQTTPSMTTLTTPTATPSSPSVAFPYGFGAGPWFHSHDPTTASPVYGHAHFWQGMNAAEPEHEHHHHHLREDQDAVMEGSAHH